MEKYELNIEDLRSLLYIYQSRNKECTTEDFIKWFIDLYHRERSKREDLTKIKVEPLPKVCQKMINNKLKEWSNG